MEANKAAGEQCEGEHAEKMRSILKHLHGASSQGVSLSSDCDI